MDFLALILLLALYNEACSGDLDSLPPPPPIEPFRAPATATREPAPEESHRPHREELKRRRPRHSLRDAVTPPVEPTRPVLAGTWSGSYTNGQGETDDDTLVLEEDSGGNLSGNWSGTVDVRGTRTGPRSFTLSGTQADPARSFRVKGFLDDGVMTLKYEATRLDSEGGSYEGTSTLTKGPGTPSTLAPSHDPDAKSIDSLRAEAEAGNAASQTDLGVRYDEGDGVAKDPVKAATWYRMAAEQGDPDGQYDLGCCYSAGSGVERDDAKAMRWWRKAAEHGQAQAQANLGNHYRDGNGVAKDEVEAVKWFRKAAEQGNPTAENNLGNCYLNGTGVHKNESAGVMWIRKAAEQNDPYAQFSLGYCYLNGCGVARDRSEAVRWYRKAAEQGDADAKETLEQLARER